MAWHLTVTSVLSKQTQSRFSVRNTVHRCPPWPWEGGWHPVHPSSQQQGRTPSIHRHNNLHGILPAASIVTAIPSSWHAKGIHRIPVDSIPPGTLWWCQEANCQMHTLTYYNPSLESVIQVDASSRGLRDVLLQEGRPIAFAIKALTAAEQRYANSERKRLAVAFGCECFHMYV